MAATKKMIEYAKGIAATLNLQEPNYDDWIDTHNFIDSNVKEYKEILHIKSNNLIADEALKSLTSTYRSFSKIFIDFVNSLDNVKGVYLFFCGNKVVYVGKSLNLKMRMLSSLEERVKQVSIDYISAIECLTEADCHILEVVLITEFKPELNVDCSCSDYSTHFKSGLTVDDFMKIKIFDEV